MFADAYYQVLIEREDVRWLLKVRRGLWTVLLFLLPLASWNDYEPNRLCSVNVVRISDGRVLISYDYKLESEAIRHQLSLIGRMREMSVGDFDRELGIGSIPGSS